MKREREQWAIETTNSRQLATELSSEIESLRNSQQFGSGGGSQQSPASTPRVSELESEIKSLKQQNNSNSHSKSYYSFVTLEYNEFFLV